MNKIKIVIGLGVLALFLFGSVYFMTQKDDTGNSSVKDNYVPVSEINSEKNGTVKLPETKTVTAPPVVKPSVTPPVTQPSAPAKPSTYTMSQVSAHNSSASCWSVINDGVYDLTNWISRHPGGAGAIREICGQDGSEDFNEQHAGENQPEKILAGYKIGDLE